MQCAICFGASDSGKRLFEDISNRYKIVAYTDNDSRKWGGSIHGIKIVSPDTAISMKPDSFVITSLPGLKAIKNQLIRSGIKKMNIDDSYVIAPLEARRIFLQRLASVLQNQHEEGMVAEAGVFEGDFAEYINLYFPNKTLHLFDTFEGFDERDLLSEKMYSNAEKGDYSNTSVEIVIKKMKYPDKVVVHKGFFPETAQGIDGKFCFVNLDLDLYEPTYAGLKFFESKMTDHGVILVHDYFARNFKGPKEAVDKFVNERPASRIVPIGDGISIMVLL